MKTNDYIVFGGGCFWCTEAVFSKFKGVENVTPGYAGGTLENPSYEQVSKGDTGYAESVKIDFDPKVISLDTLLNIFFATHDPTTLNKQGGDVGEQYRSIIFYTTLDQEKTIKEYISKLEDIKEFNDPIVTEVEKLDKFYDAEEYHRKFFDKNPNNPYCQIVISPKIQKIYEKFPELLK